MYLQTLKCHFRIFLGVSLSKAEHFHAPLSPVLGHDINTI